MKTRRSIRIMFDISDWPFSLLLNYLNQNGRRYLFFPISVHGCEKNKARTQKINSALSLKSYCKWKHQTATCCLTVHMRSPLFYKNTTSWRASRYESRCFLSSCVTWIKRTSLISIISPGKKRKRKRSRSGCMCSRMLARQLCIIKAFWSLPRLSPGIRWGNQTCWKSSQKLELWDRTEERSRFVWFSFAALLVLLQASRRLYADPLSSK